MLLRPYWTTSKEEALSLIDADPWALLINNGQETPFVTATPLLLDRRNDMEMLVGHIARDNPQAASLQNGTRALALFQGPRAYISPSFYPDRNMAPTMYHVLVEVEGTISLQNPDETQIWIEKLTNRYEAKNPDRWQMQELPADGIARRIKAIVGFEILVTAVRGKAKLGQDEPRRDSLAAATKLSASQSDHDRQISTWVQQRNILVDKL